MRKIAFAVFILLTIIGGLYMSYVGVNDGNGWEDYPSTNTPRNAANFNIMEGGIKANDTAIGGLQKQLNQLVIEGDSSVEAAQARVNYDGVAFDTLKDRLDDSDAKINNIATLELVDDIASTEYVAGNKIDTNNIKTKQAVLYAEFCQKLRTMQAVQIACIGDSLTEGYDIVSDDKVVGGNGGTPTVASSIYPAKLQEFLNQIYDNNVTVINRGFSGDWVKQAYTRWDDKHTSDLSIIMYGTNDVSGEWVPDDYRGKIEEYISWYEQFIIREILWDKAVIILTPPKPQNTSNVALDVYRNALYLLGEKYGIPVIDAEEFTKNYSPVIYSDGTHFNGTGYAVFGAKVANLFIGEGLKNIRSVTDGTKLLCRPSIDSIVYFGGTSFTTTTPTNTPNETHASNGIVASIPSGAGIIYSFYAEKDDLMVLPYSYLSTGATMQLELDFGVPQPQNSLDGAIYKSMGSDSEPSSVSYDTAVQVYSKKVILDGNKAILRIVSDGWHTLKISSSGAPSILNGIEFMSYEDYYSYMNTIPVSGTWTPEWDVDNIDGTNTYSVREGTYIKIGKLVFVRGTMTMTAKDPTMYGLYLAIKNLPYAPSNVTAAVVGSVQNLTLPSGKTTVFARVSTSGKIALLAGNISGSAVPLDSTAITNTTSIEFSATYIIN